MSERARLGLPFVRAGDLDRGDVVDLGGLPFVVLEALEGPRGTPGDPRTVWLRLEGGLPARPMLETDPVRLVTDLAGRGLWTRENVRRDHDRAADTRDALEQTVGAAVLSSWAPVCDLPGARAVVYLAVVTAAAVAGGEAKPAAIRALVGGTDSTVQGHLRGLVADGLVVRRRVGETGAFLYRPDRSTSGVDGQAEAV